MKRNTYSVSGKCETDYRIRFKKFPIFFLKRISNSVSHFSETDQVFRFMKQILKFVKRNTNSVSEKCETEFEIRFIKFHVLFSQTGFGIRFKMVSRKCVFGSSFEIYRHTLA